MELPIYHTFDTFFENYLDNFIDIKKYTDYKNYELKEYNYSLLFKYNQTAKNLYFDDEDEFVERKKHIETVFSPIQLMFFFDEYEIEEESITLGNIKKVIKILSKEMWRISQYLRNEIQRKEIEEAELKGNKLFKIDSIFDYSADIQKNANAFFRGDIKNIELLKYLSNNFHSSNEKTSNLTKFNQIFAYFNSHNSEMDKSKGNLDKNAYKQLIKHLFGFDYGNREIKGETQKHIEQLENLTKQYYEILN